MKRRIFIYVILSQLIIIISVAYHIFAQNQDNFGSSINPIIFESLHSSPSGNLRYYYEPKRNTLIKDKKKNFPYFGEYTINDDSLNSLRNYLVEKPTNVFRIITLGDSYTYGLYVNTKDNWPSLLESKLNSQFCTEKFEVINLGVEGYDSRYIVERFRKRGIKYNPDLVIWLHVDLLRVRDLLPPLIEKYLKYNELRVAKTNEVSFNAWAKASEELRNIYGDQGLLEYNKAAILSIPKFEGRLLTVPMTAMVRDNEKEMLRDISKERNWIYSDILTDLRRVAAFFEEDRHPNTKGHEIIANDIFDFLKKSNIVNCK